MRLLHAKNLTPLDWFVYRLLEERTLGTKNSVSQREIYEACKEAGYGVSWNESQNQHNDHCRWLHDVVEHINFTDEVDHMVGHHCWRYRLLSMEEAANLVIVFNDKEKKARERKVALLEKMKRHGQGKLLSNQGNPIDDDSSAKEFYEAFNEIFEEFMEE